MARRRTLGTVEGQHNHWRARYQREGRRHVPGRTFSTEELAWAWLRSEQSLIDRGEWTPPAARREKQRAAEQREAETSIPFGAYARDWIANRTTPRGTPLAPRTVSEYHAYLEGPLADFAGRQLFDVSRADVKAWWQRHSDTPRYRHHAYAFAKSVYKAAVKDGLLDANPWDIDNAARVVLQTPKAVRATMINDLTPEDVQRLADATQPAQWQALVLLLAWTGLRPGEAFALQRRDLKASYIDATPSWRIHVARAVSRSRTPEGGRADTIGTPKTPESIRYVWLPPAPRVSHARAPRPLLPAGTRRARVPIDQRSSALRDDPAGGRDHRQAAPRSKRRKGPTPVRIHRRPRVHRDARSTPVRPQTLGPPDTAERRHG